MKQFLLAIAAITFTLYASAQAPHKVSYQSVIRNSSGSLISNGAVSMRISILQGSASGTPVYVESHSATTNANGLASLQIGGGTVVSGDMSTIDWSLGPYFLKTETDPAGGTNYSISATTELLSVPYALYAERAGSGAGSGQWVADANGINYTSGSVGIGIASEANVGLVAKGQTTGVGGNAAKFISDDPWHTSVALKNGNNQYTMIVAGPSDIELTPQDFGLFNGTLARWPLTVNHTNNNIGIGNPTPYPQPAHSTLHVFTGDVNIDQIGSGIIMKSPNGQCWRVTIDNSGAFTSTAISCP